MPLLRPGREVPDRGADAPVRAEEVRAHDLLEAVVRPVGVRAADAAVRDESVDRAPRRGRRGERGRDAVAVADVAEVRAAADPRRHLLELVEVRREQREDAPSAASRSAIAFPIPWPPPVTTTCLPASDSIPLLFPLFA